MSDADTVSSPVSLAIDTEGEATLTFGPMPLEDMGLMLDYLGTGEGYDSFRVELNTAIEQKLADLKGDKAP